MKRQSTKTQALNTYKLTVVREAGIEPLTNKAMPEARETLTIEAPDLHEAFLLSEVYQTLRFGGMERRVFAEDGAELLYEC